MAAKGVLQQEQPALRRLLEAISNGPLKEQLPLRGPIHPGPMSSGSYAGYPAIFGPQHPERHQPLPPGFWRGIGCRKPSETESTNALGRKKMCCSAC
jgi:hypothetical protein